MATKNRIEKLDSRISNLEQQVSIVATKVDMLVTESQQQREDIRRLQDRHDAEMHEMNRRFYEKLDENYKDLTKQLHTNFIQTMIGVGAIMVAIGGLIIAVLK